MTERRVQPTSRTATLLRNPLSVLSAAAASFLVVLALLTGRVMTGQDPALLSASASSPALISKGGHTVLRTTASGKVIGGATPAVGTEASGAQPASFVTRTSGGAAGGGRDE